MATVRTFRRGNFFPHSMMEFLPFCVVVVCVPFTYWLLVFDIIPKIHPTDGIYYQIVRWGGLFVVFNILGNFLGCTIVDTSVKSVRIVPPYARTVRDVWHHCKECEIIAPPRSRHCYICRTCILKRDHHCSFTGYCIGFQNHRYFVVFMIYLAFGSFFTFSYQMFHAVYIRPDLFLNVRAMFNMLLPMVAFSTDISLDNFYVLMLMFNILCIGFIIVVPVIHIYPILYGALEYEPFSKAYNRGFKKNMEMILGKRMFLAMIAPFIKSELPHDGVHWETILREQWGATLQ